MSEAIALCICSENDVKTETTQSKPSRKSKKQEQFQQLNNIVLEYQVFRKDSDFEQILKLTNGLVYKILDQYKLLTFAPTIIEDVSDDCKSRVLLKAIQSYDISKGSFSTHYFWKMRSYVSYRRRYYNQRYGLTNAQSFDAAFSDENDKSLEDIYMKDYSPRMHMSIKKHINDLFGE